MSDQPERVVFIDETSAKTNLTRLRGWAPRGDRLIMDAPFGSWGTQTFIAGLTADAVIAPWVIKGAMDGPAFATCVEKVLVPKLAPGTVVILDDLATHKNAAAAKAMRDAGCWFLFLPPYRSGPQSHRDQSNALSNAWRSRSHILKAQGPPQAHRCEVVQRNVRGHRRDR
ncbi:MAG: transposase [Paracoccus sp. (in: a-proteobacteria)]